jgi:hypothetical protein
MWIVTYCIIYIEIVSRLIFYCLDGGFSGNVVLRAKSIDNLGHNQVPTVIKIGARDLIAKERSSFERIEEVLGK